MSVGQSQTPAEVDQITKGEIVQDELINIKQEQWITFVALGGLITSESDDENNPVSIRQMPVSEFSAKVGVPRSTLYEWKKRIPNFGARVRKRREEVFSLSRETQLFNRAYLIGMHSKDHKAAGDMIKMLLGHSAQLMLPAQRHEIEAGQSLVDLANAARKRNIIEGDTVGNDNHAGTGA